MSAELTWQIIRKNSCFLRRQKGIKKHFSVEPFNLRGINSPRFNGFISKKAMNIAPAKDGKGVVVSVKIPGDILFYPYCMVQFNVEMSEVTCWQAFHQYNMVVMAYQDRMRAWQAYSPTGTTVQRRQGVRYAGADQNEPNIDERRPRNFLRPIPASAREVTVIHNPNGPDLLAAQFQVASYLRRFMAEVIDFVFAFFIKLLLVYYLVEMDFLQLLHPLYFCRFDKLLGNEADLQTLVDVTQELFPLELLGKLACSLLEALCLSQSLFPRFFGQTPGKYIMRVRVIECGSVSHVAGAPPNVVRVTGVLSIPFKAAILRSMLKNILINSLVPFSTVAFAFNNNRAIYDILARTIVIVD
ncbi:ribosomal L28e protein [Cooperia oncophora]